MNFSQFGTDAQNVWVTAIEEELHLDEKVKITLKWSLLRG